MKTYSTKPSEVRRTWHVLDAADVPLGRLATRAAHLIRGKHKPIFAPHLDTGDFVIVVNAARVALTGRKMEQKKYYRHSGYPGGLKTRSVREMNEANPASVVEAAVFGMLPKNTLGKTLHGHLKVYPGAEHPHAAQVNGPAQPSLSQPPLTPRRRAKRPTAPAPATAQPIPGSGDAPTLTPATPIEAAEETAYTPVEPQPPAEESVEDAEVETPAYSALEMTAEQQGEEHQA